MSAPASSAGAARLVAVFPAPNIILAMLLAIGPSAPVDPFVDPLDRPAARTTLVASTPVNAIARAGQRLVAVGIRGLVIVSDDEGATWRQVEVPVASDLTALQFVTPALGWAVGHDGVVLHSADGGLHWTRQLDGRMTAQLLNEHFAARAARGDRDASSQLEAVRQNYAAGPEQALLGVWFKDAMTGWVCGSFGTLLATRDGGKTWQSSMEHIDNPRALHLNAMTAAGSSVLIASEQGTVFRLDPQRQRFVAQATGYAGSFFGFVARDDVVLAYGLRGTAFRSRDAGHAWTKLATGVPAGLNGGAVFPDGALVLVSQDGRVLLSTDDGDSFRALSVPRPGVFTAIAPAGARAAVVGGLAGIGVLALH